MKSLVAIFYLLHYVCHETSTVHFNIYFLITPVNVIACIHKLCQKYTLDFKQAPVRGTVYFIVNLLQQRTKKVSATQLPGGIRICINYNIANILK